MEDIIMKPNRDSDKELDRKVAQLIGLEISECQYRSLDGVNRTIFTNPPQFSVNERLVDYMLEFARKNGVKVTSRVPEIICNEIIKGMEGEK